MPRASMSTSSLFVFSWLAFDGNFLYCARFNFFKFKTKHHKQTKANNFFITVTFFSLLYISECPPLYPNSVSSCRFQSSETLSAESRKQQNNTFRQQMKLTRKCRKRKSYILIVDLNQLGSGSELATIHSTLFFQSKRNTKWAWWNKTVDDKMYRHV